MQLSPELTGVQILKLSAEGTLLAGPPEARELAEVISYALELASIVGDGLGLESLRAAEFAGPSGFLMVSGDGDGQGSEATVLSAATGATSPEWRGSFVVNDAGALVARALPASLRTAVKLVLCGQLTSPRPLSPPLSCSTLILPEFIAIPQGVTRSRKNCLPAGRTLASIRGGV